MTRSLNRHSEHHPALLKHAREYIQSDIGYTFTETEKSLLQNFFSNISYRIFYVHGLPSNMMASVTSMYSRMKNPRGLRGVFVDSFLPSVLATGLPEVEKDFAGDSEKFLTERKIKTLQAFIDYSQKSRAAFTDFIENYHIDPEYVKILADSKKAKRFLDAWLDKYGHNSIARMGNICICFERISMLAAKSIEWSRPGCGYVELSSRYVDMGGADMYPIAEELALLGVKPGVAKKTIATLFSEYQGLQGDDFNGPLPEYLRQTYGKHLAETPEKLKLGVTGETCDVAGNLLPAGTLTSLCATVSGEAFPSLLRHLYLDNLPENHAIVEFLVEEGRKIGADQFARHYEVTPEDHENWCPFPITRFLEDDWTTISARPLGPLPDDAPLTATLALGGHKDIKTACKKLLLLERDNKNFRKLPREFESLTCAFYGTMPFRDWRDLQRMGMSTHKRSPLSPHIGFYIYDKPHPAEVDTAFAKAHKAAWAAWKEYGEAVSPVLLQYLMPLGCKIGFLYAANIRQHEFCNWQRSKPDVNHSVRQTFLDVEETLRNQYSWYPAISRANLNRKYAFARGSAIRID